MDDLWFDADISSPTEVNDLRYTVTPRGLWAVHTGPQVYGRAEQESREILAFYGAAVEGAGWLLSTVPVPLPRALERWAQHRDVPAEDIGVGTPELLKVDGVRVLAMAWQFDSVRAIATTYGQAHILAFVPSEVASISLVQTRGSITRA